MTDAELTVLSLLAQGPHYGHELQQTIDDRGLREWLVIGFSSLYYILNKLEEQQFVQSELRANGRGPARKYYALTEAGRGVLQTAVSDLLRQPRTIGSGFELGLANLHVLKPAQVYRVLTHHRQDLRVHYMALLGAWQRHQREDGGRMTEPIGALYTHSLNMMEADLKWLEQFLIDWRERYPGIERDANREESAAKPASATTTLIHRRTSPGTLKMIQRLKPLKPADDSTEGGDPR